MAAESTSPDALSYSVSPLARRCQSAKGPARNGDRQVLLAIPSKLSLITHCEGWRHSLRGVILRVSPVRGGTSLLGQARSVA
jgi:hypothetical protein